MSRRVPQPSRGQTGIRANRMAKGGRVNSESRVRRNVPRIGDAGEEVAVRRQVSPTASSEEPPEPDES